ncbi:MAG: hypothetical protein E7660_04435 [Ruminococcaceae bacterium]|nr:hypothetical protein [Oscillospiraceae bacterium]
MKRILNVLALLLLFATLSTTVVSASSAYATYTYSSDGFVLESPDAYSVDSIIDGEYMGVDLVSPEDLEVGPDGNIYIADAGAQAIVVLDSYYKYKFSITGFVNEQGVRDGFLNPKGVYATKDKIYVCDTDNSRLVIFDLEGNFIKTVAQPESNLFEEDAIYKPVAIAVDTYGRLFVVSSTTYQGIIVMSDDGDFYGFIGAQKVSVSAIDALWKKFRTSAQEASEDVYVSKEYNNITIDSENFIYVTTSTIDESVQQANIGSKDGTYAPVKKFNASGTDVLRRNGFFAPSGEVHVSTSKTATISGASTIVDAAIGPEGTWTIADQKRSKVFTYDAEGNLLFAFGDMGSLKGNIGNLNAVTYLGNNMLLLDKSASSITVFRRTEYGDILLNAIKNQNARLYDTAVDDWQEILKRNNNFDVAYIGIGKALAREGYYEDAMTYFKYSHEKEGRYAEAFKEIRKEWASKYFIIIPIVAVAVLLGLSWVLGYASKVNKKASLKVGTKTIKEELLYAFHIMTHPFDGFWDLKHEKRGSVRSAFIILLITVIAFFYQAIGTGYVMSQKSADDYGSIYTAILSVAVPVLLWVIANWCLTTLFDGEGKIGDIFTATCYALTPLPLFVIPSVILSNFLVPEEEGIISLLVGIGWVWAGLLIFTGTMTTHGYSVGKNFIITLFTILGMAAIMFLAILFSTLMVKIVSLFSNIWVEISYRL